MTRATALLLTGENVNATLEGRKKATRRVCPVQPVRDEDGQWHVLYPWGEGGHGIYPTFKKMRDEFDRVVMAHCPYQRERLWVRETWRYKSAGLGLLGDPGATVEFRSNGEVRSYRLTAAEYKKLEDQRKRDEKAERDWHVWRPSIFLPRWACRLQLQVDNVRIEQLHDITVEGIIAEGIKVPDIDPDADEHPDGQEVKRRQYAYQRWRELWDSINSKRGFSWAANPMVFVVDYTALKTVLVNGRSVVCVP